MLKEEVEREKVKFRNRRTKKNDKREENENFADVKKWNGKEEIQKRKIISVKEKKEREGR